jgi:hypothetical protein
MHSELDIETSSGFLLYENASQPLPDRTLLPIARSFMKSVIHFEYPPRRWVESIGAFTLQPVAK